MLEIILTKKHTAPQMARALLVLIKRFFGWVVYLRKGGIGIRGRAHPQSFSQSGAKRAHGRTPKKVEVRLNSPLRVGCSGAGS